MMKRFHLAALAALILFTGCQHTEQEAPVTSVKTVRFLASATGTRTAFDEEVNGVYQTRWTSNDTDVLLSLNYGKAEPSAVTPSADGATASFEASFDASEASSPYTFYAVSPASAARAISPSRSAWSVYVAAEQKPLATSVDEAAQLLVAKSAASETLPDEVNLHFAHLTAYGRISLQNLTLSDAIVSKAELVFSTPVVGEWYWVEDGTLLSNGSSHTITLDTDASGDLWFACAPVDVSGQTMKLTLFTDRGVLSKEITFPEGRKFTSGKVARFSVDMAGIEPGGSVPVEGDPLTASDVYGSYLPDAMWTYTKGVDQMVRSYPGGKLEFVLLKPATKEQLVVSGFDPSLTKGGTATVSVVYRQGKKVLLDKEFTFAVVKEDGPKVWLGDGSGQGLILKK
jgi:hypothetical protein